MVNNECIQYRATYNMNGHSELAFLCTIQATGYEWQCACARAYMCVYVIGLCTMDQELLRERVGWYLRAMM